MMSIAMADRFRKWYEHEKDAHANVVRSLESVPSDQRTSPEFQKAVCWLAHLAMARRVWLERLGVIPAKTSGPFFPEGKELADTIADLKEVQELWSRYLAKLSDDELAQRIEYNSLDAGRFGNRIEDILTQLFTHSAYHRGQIASLVRAAGGEPAATDYIYWCREPVAEC
jgi:uncharacterized damage-inducible protein DinB